MNTALFALFAVTVIVVLVAFETGLGLGRWRSRQPLPEPLLPARMIISAVLSLNAFVLGFTFSVAASHFDARNQALDNEAIAIATAYHRADLLEEPERTNVRGLLREYLDLRLEAPGSANVDEVIHKLRSLQERIWSQAIRSQPQSIVIQSLNEVIDVRGEHALNSMRSRIPFGVWTVLYGITVISIMAGGYHSGLAGAGRRSIAALAYALVFAGVIVMIADADIPGFGHFEENRKPLLELQVRFTHPDYR